MGFKTFTYLPPQETHTGGFQLSLFQKMLGIYCLIPISTEPSQETNNNLNETGTLLSRLGEEDLKTEIVYGSAIRNGLLLILRCCNYSPLFKFSGQVLPNGMGLSIAGEILNKQMASGQRLDHLVELMFASFFHETM